MFNLPTSCTFQFIKQTTFSVSHYFIPKIRFRLRSLVTRRLISNDRRSLCFCFSVPGREFLKCRISSQMLDIQSSKCVKLLPETDYPNCYPVTFKVIKVKTHRKNRPIRKRQETFSPKV